MARRGRPASGATSAAAAALATAVAATLAIAGHDAPPAGAARAARAALELLPSGCAAVLERTSGSACAVGEAPFRIVVRGARTPLRVRVEGGPSRASDLHAREVALARASEGTRLEITLAASPRARRLVVEDAAGRRGAIVLVPDEAAPAWLTAARAARERGDLDAAEARLAEAPAHDPRALSLRARVALARGELGVADALFARAEAAHGARGDVSARVDDGLARAFALGVRGHRLADARAVLARLEPDAERYPDGAARLPYYRGILDADRGDTRAALAGLERARAAAEALGLARLARTVASSRALVLAAVGRHADARATLVEARATGSLAPCEDATLALNEGWVAIAAGAPREAEVALTRALAARCADRALEATALDDLALVVAEQREFGRADALLARADALPSPGPGELASRAEIRARIALGRGRASDARAFARGAADLARAAGAAEAERRALEVLGDAALAAGRHDEAAAAFAEAEDLVDSSAARVPLGEGRDRYVRAGRRTARGLVDAHLLAGRPEAAFRAAVRAETRLVRGLALAGRVAEGPERDAWERALTTYLAQRDALDRELASARDWAVAPDELARRADARTRAEHAARRELDAALGDASRALGLDALDGADDGPVLVLVGDDAKAIALLRTGPELVRAAPADRDALAALVAGARLGDRPRAGSGVGASALRVVGTVDDARFSAVEAAAGVPLVVGLAAGPRPEATPATGAAVVVADPRGDLPEARAEGDAVAARLRERGGRTLLLVRGDATREGVLRALPGAPLAHVAAHGRDGGTDGASAALLLAQGSTLGVVDVLALPGAPRAVVLASCAAGATSAASGLSLAHAFVARGAAWVVAPVRAVDDRAARALSDALHEALARGFPPPTALAEARRAVGPAADGFRMFVP